MGDRSPFVYLGPGVGELVGELGGALVGALVGACVGMFVGANGGFFVWAAIGAGEIFGFGVGGDDGDIGGMLCSSS